MLRNGSQTEKSVRQLSTQILTMFVAVTKCTRRLQCLHPWRGYATSTPPLSKPAWELVSELRKSTGAPFSKVREALWATNNDLEAAVEWLQNDLAESGAQKAAKVEGRTANEGLIGLSVLSRGLSRSTGLVRAAMVELNCETDFVARNELFGKLVADVAHSAAFHAEMQRNVDSSSTVLNSFKVDELMEAPLMQEHPFPSSSIPPTSVGVAIRDTIAKVGEKISLRRAITAVLDGQDSDHDFTKQNGGGRIAWHAHGGTPPSQGRMAALVFLHLRSPQIANLFDSDMFTGDLEKLERALARQVTGVETKSIITGNTERTLYKQPFIMYPGDLSGLSVGQAISKWQEQQGLVAENGEAALRVRELARWTVGEATVNDDTQIVRCKFLKNKLQQPLISIPYSIPRSLQLMTVSGNTDDPHSFVLTHVSNVSDRPHIILLYGFPQHRAPIRRKSNYRLGFALRTSVSK